LKRIEERETSQTATGEAHQGRGANQLLSLHSRLEAIHIDYKGANTFWLLRK
jgi:hypothetical protein